MKTITISGATSGVGKTNFAERLLKILKGEWSYLKVTVLHNGACPTGRDCGACGDTDGFLPRSTYAVAKSHRVGGIQSDGFSIVSDENRLNEKGKDTARLKIAGAKRVLWLKSRPDSLKEGLKRAISMFEGQVGLVIEGTSVLKILKPDLAIFVKKKDSILKPSAKEIINRVDFTITV